MRLPAIPAFAAGFVALLSADPAWAVDLTVASVEVTQALRARIGEHPMVARNATLVRATIGLAGASGPVAGVDAVLHVYSDGVEIPESPVYSWNGPIAAPIAPSSENENDTINFLCLPPEGGAITFEVTVNPFGTVIEDSVANNTLTLPAKPCVCRSMMELAYVPVDYVPGGGLPNASMIEPGMGDAFLRAIYKVGDWNYHRSPLPPLVHTLDINISNINLLNTLADVRQSQIPAVGYPRPEFVFAWLPGNPYIGNGQALGTPSSVAFGNTDPARFQRTFAHEIGHCWGQPHNQQTILVPGFDVEQQLRDPLGIGALMPSTKRDVMVPSLNTVDAWVASVTFLDAIDDARSQCITLDGGVDDGGSPADDATSVLRIAGVHDLVRRRVTLEPAMVHERVKPTEDDPEGNVLVESFDEHGVRLHAVRANTLSCAESCAEAGRMATSTSLYVNLPRVIDGREAARVRVREIRGGAAGRPLGELVRSAHAPRVRSLMVDMHEATVGPASDRARVTWAADDADGDALVADLLYSRDGGQSWIPLTVGESTGSFEFNVRDVPASVGALGRFAVRVSDGMNVAFAESATRQFGGGQPPDVHIIGPSPNVSFPRGATVLLHGSAWDMEDLLLPDEVLTWSSSIDGPLGVGRMLVRRNLSVGTHVLTFRGRDSSGMAAERTVTITITPRVYNDANLDGEGVVDARDLVVLLGEWGGTGVGDIDLDGVVGPRDLSVLLQRWGF